MNCGGCRLWSLALKPNHLRRVPQTKFARFGTVKMNVLAAQVVGLNDSGVRHSHRQFERRLIEHLNLLLALGKRSDLARDERKPRIGQVFAKLLDHGRKRIQVFFAEIDIRFSLMPEDARDDAGVLDKANAVERFVVVTAVWSNFSAEP